MSRTKKSINKNTETKDQMVKPLIKTAGTGIAVSVSNIRPNALVVTRMIEPYKIINYKKLPYNKV